MTAAQCHLPSIARRAGLVRLLCGSAGAFSMLAAAPATAQTCGPLGSPYGIGGCVVPGNSTTPPVRIYSDPLNPGGFRSAPVAPAPTFNRPMPPGLNRDYSQPGVPGLY